MGGEPPRGSHAGCSRQDYGQERQQNRHGRGSGGGTLDRCTDTGRKGHLGSLDMFSVHMRVPEA